MPPKASSSKTASEQSQQHQHDGKNSIRDVARKAATKAAVSQALILPWPSMPQHARSQALTATLNMLDGVKQYRQAQARYNHRSSLSKPRIQKRKRPPQHERESQNEPQAGPSTQTDVPQTFHTVTLRSGKDVQVPDHRLPYALPDVSASRLQQSQKTTPPPQQPDILSHLLIGINSVQASLELFIQAARAESSDQPLPHKRPPTQLSRSDLLRKRQKDKRSKRANKLVFPPLSSSSSNGNPSSASFLYLQQMYGRPMLNQVNRNSLSLGEPWPGLSALEIFGGPRSQSRRSKEQHKQAQGYNLPPGLLETTISVLQSANLPQWSDRPAALSHYIRTSRLKAAQKHSRQKRKVRTAAKTSKSSDPSVAAAAATVSAPFDPTQAARSALDNPLRVILVCRPDVNPKDLLAHLPTTVASANGMLAKQDKPGIRLVQLNAGAEKALAEALGIKSAAVLGIKGSAQGDKLDTLMKILEHHQPPPLRSAHLDGVPNIEELDSLPTTIRIMQTTVPTDSRALRQSRREEKKNKKNKAKLRQQRTKTKAQDKSKVKRAPGGTTRPRKSC